jgi:predicted metal-dependent phosphoesterase TrpH
MPEIVANIHMHTTYSDGHTTHAGIAAAALKTDVDVVIVTDHNVWVNGVDRFYQEKDRRVLLLAGEEIHDPNRQPQKNHLLVVGAGRELAPYAPDPQKLLDQVQLSEGLAFLAHPNESALAIFGEDDISWVNWEVHGYTGLEVWNHLSEIKTAIRSIFHAVYFPPLLPDGSQPRHPG